MDPGAHMLREAVAYMRERHGLDDLEALRLIAVAVYQGDLQLVASVQLAGRTMGMPRSFAPDDWAGVVLALGERGCPHLSWDPEANWIGVDDGSESEGWFHIRFHGFDRWTVEKLPRLVSQQRMEFATMVEAARSFADHGWTTFYRECRGRPEFSGIKKTDFREAFRTANGLRPSGRPRSKNLPETSA